MPPCCYDQNYLENDKAERVATRPRTFIIELLSQCGTSPFILAPIRGFPAPNFGPQSNSWFWLNGLGIEMTEAGRNRLSAIMSSVSFLTVATITGNLLKEN